MTDPVVLFLAGLVGLALGSFLNVCVARWPRGGSVARPRSACPACSASVAWHDQIPVASWLLLRGRCRRCAARISLRYPLVEVAGAAICVLAVLTRGVGLEAAGAAVLLLTLLGIALTDAREYLIPDEFSLGGAVAGLALSLAPGGVTPSSAVAGAALGFGGMWLVGTVGTWVLARARPHRLAEAGRAHERARRRARDARGVRFLSGPRGQLVAGAPIPPAVLVAGWWFGSVGVAAAVAAGAFGLAVLVAWVEGLGRGDDSGPREAAASAPDEGHGHPSKASPHAAVPSTDSSAAPAPPATTPRPDDVAPPPGVPMTVLGGGDVKMMAMVGAFTGPWGVVLTVFLGALVGLLAYLKLRLLLGTRHLVPLGVFLAVGAAITLWWGRALLDGYLRWSGLS